MPVPTLVALILMALASPGPAVCHDEPLVPMPADVAPHHKGFVAGEHHFDISNKPESTRHFGDHFISYGHHNYDLSEDPSRAGEYPHHNRRYRGMGAGERERCSIVRKDLDDLDDTRTEPYILRRAWQQGMRYRRPEDEVAAQRESHPYGFPRPSWYAVYAKKPDPYRRTAR